MQHQKLYNIIFSDNRSYRWKRHILFWLAVFLYHLVRISFIFPVINNMQSLRSLLGNAFSWGIILNIFFSYSIVYFLIPRYFNRKKYTAFIIGIVLLIVIMLSYGIGRMILNTDQTFFEALGVTKHVWAPGARASFIRVFGNPPLIFGLFLSLKTLKNWHLEQLKTETVAKENTNAELQLLKAQIHPHFLFNTLNNNYSFTLAHSPLAGILVQKLSDMLNYMIHECKEPFVPLEKEIKLIRDYMGLEKVRYGKRLDMQIEIKGDCKNKMIAPLLMIPFVENCFKHGASVMRGQQWIKLSIHVNEDQLDFNLSNSKPVQIPDTDNKKGIGLANVQKRLQLIYPGKYLLNTSSTNDTYIVHLQVSLRQLVLSDIEYKQPSILQPV